MTEEYSLFQEIQRVLDPLTICIFLFEEEANVTLIIPDRNKPSQEDFVWALPVDTVKWKKWYELSRHYKTTTPMNVRYMSRVEGKEVKTIVLLPTDRQTDDDAMTAAAWLRMVKKFSCRIYVIRPSTGAEELSGAKLINAVMGLDPDTLTEMDDGEENPNATP